MMWRRGKIPTGPLLAMLTTQLQECTATLQTSAALQVALRNELAEQMALVARQSTMIRHQAEQILILKQRLGITTAEPNE